MSCLDDPTVFDFVSGRLDAANRLRVEEELARCGRCAGLVGALMRGSVALGLGSSLEGDPGDGASATPGASVTPAASEAAEARYRLGPVIARGGMGTIFAARDRQLEREVAIKCLATSDATLLARFGREIRVTASLQHPAIVPIYDSGRLPDGRHFYAMRHVHGGSLEGAIEHAASPRDRLALLAPLLAVAEAVAYAHERGVVHRDLKPSNVLVGPFGETVVIDWGLARIDAERDDAALLAAPAGDALTTRVGAVMGTPRYMAPEQARGEPATRASDVWALGALLYHALSGQPPVAGDDVRVLLERVARAEVVPLAQVAPALPGDLVAIVSRAMARDPAERYSVAGELAADLRRFQTGQLVAAHVYSRRELALRFVRRHRAAVTLSALFALLLGVGGVLSVRRILAESERAAVQRARAERERGGAEDLVQFLLYDQRRRLEGVGRLDVLGSVCDRVESYYKTFAAERAEEPEVLVKRAALTEVRAAVALDAGEVAAADADLAAALALLDRAPDQPSGLEVRARVLGGMAIREEDHGALSQARAHFVEAAALFARAPAPGGNHRNLDAARARMLLGAGTMADRQGEIAKAEQQWGEARQVLEALLVGHAEDHASEATLTEALTAMGRGRLRRGAFPKAEEPLRAAVAHGEAITRAEPRHAPFRYALLTALSTLADVRSAAGDPDESRTLQERARQAAVELVALEPASARWHTALAEAARELGRSAGMREDWTNATRYLTEARGEYEHLLELDPKNLGIHEEAAMTLGMLADCETFANHMDAARARWEDSLRHLEIVATLAPRERLEWAFGLQGYSQLELQLGDVEGAAASIDKALGLVLATPTSGDEPQQVSHRAWVLTQLGQVREAQHRGPEAKLYYQQAATCFQALAQRHALQAGWRAPIDILRKKARWVEQP